MLTYAASCEPAYPAALRAIPDPPPVIGVRGHLRMLSANGVGIVGARNASAAGRRMAATLAQDLGKGGLVVISGLARGIDGAAHEAALPSGTVAVVAGGLDRVFEVNYRQLADHLRKLPDEVNSVIRLLDGFRTMHDVIDDSPLGAAETLTVVSKLHTQALIHDVTPEEDDDPLANVNSPI